MIKGIARVTYVKYWKNNWGIVSVNMVKAEQGDKYTEPKTDKYGEFIVKGSMPKVIIGDTYNIIANEIIDETYGVQYNLVFMNQSSSVSNADEQKIFLSKILTEKQLESIYDEFENPFEIIKNEDITSLTKVSGIGLTTGYKIIDKYKETIDYSDAYIKLQALGLTDMMVKRLCDTYKSPDVLIEKFEENPYILCEDVDGIGFKRADEFARKYGVDEKSPKRVKAFIKNFLREESLLGNSWVSTILLAQEASKVLGLADKQLIGQSLMEMDNLWWSKDKEKIGLKKIYNLENNIATELMRLQSAKNILNYNNWEDKIKKIEENVGFEYTSEQKKGVETVLKNNVVCITGLAGSGKTTITKAIIDILKTYDFAQCALAGKAAQRMSEVTGYDGFTIHRLLKFQPPMGFAYNKENQLDENIIILDETSMVGGELFYSLIKAIRTGSKLIILGDSGQLPSIGTCNIFHDLLNNGTIKVVTLNEIHRQAKKSAIITESHKIRKKEQIIEKNFVGKKILGELQDLELDVYSDKSESGIKIIKQFKEKYELVESILDIQVLVAMKQRGDICTYRLNNALQKLVNPESEEKEQVELSWSKDMKYKLREGDKVINVKNNYKAINLQGDITPVFNGNIGILEKINAENGLMIVDFENIGRVIIKKENWKNTLLGYAITVHKCITEDTWLYSNNGLIQLKDLNNGANIGEFKQIDKNIKIFNGEYMESPKSFYNDGKSMCRNITTRRGYGLTCTMNHKIDVIGETGYITTKEAKDITKEDYLLISKNQNIYGDIIDLPTEWARENRKRKLDTRTILYNRPQKMTLEFARLLGYVVADGTLTPKSLKFSKRYKNVVIDFENIVKKLFNYTNSSIKLRPSNDYMCEINSADIADFLNNIDGLQPHKKFVPKCILEAPKEYQQEFLKAVFEDCTVNLKKQKFDHIELSMKDLKFNEQVRLMLLNMGIISSYKKRIKHKENKKYVLHLLYIYKKDAIIFQDKIGFVSEIKKERLKLCTDYVKYTSERITIPHIYKIMKELIKKYNFKFETYLLNEKIKQAIRNKKITEHLLSLFLNVTKKEMELDDAYNYLKIISENYYIDKVDRLTKENKKTYCLEMPETHTFIQNGIQAKNSQGSQWSHVIVGIDYSSYMSLSCEWLYTAITRAQEHCVLVGENSAIRYATSVTKTPIKQTHLCNILKHL